jgi:hypothetical protein
MAGLGRHTPTHDTDRIVIGSRKIRGMTKADQPSTALTSNLEEVFPTGMVVHWRKVTRGYTLAERWVVTFSDGSSCFVKGGDDVRHAGMAESIAHGLRKEARIYSQLSGFLPTMLGWLDTPEMTAARSR